MRDTETEILPDRRLVRLKTQNKFQEVSTNSDPAIQKEPEFLSSQSHDAYRRRHENEPRIATRVNAKQVA